MKMDGHVIFAVLILLFLAVMAACLPVHAKDPVPNAPAVVKAEPQAEMFTVEQIQTLIQNHEAGLAKIEEQIHILQERRLAVFGAIQGLKQLQAGQPAVKEEKK